MKQNNPQDEAHRLERYRAVKAENATPPTLAQLAGLADSWDAKLKTGVRRFTVDEAIEIAKKPDNEIQRIKEFVTRGDKRERKPYSERPRRG